MPVVFFGLSSPKIFTMKRALTLLLLTAFLAAGCSDTFKKQLKIYDKAIEELDGTDNLQELMNEVLSTGTEIARILSDNTENENEELRADYGEEYELMRDSIETARDRYYSRADMLFKGYIHNFVELRTLLYKMAADRFCTASSIEELEAIKEIVKRYSALSFIASQRACDPPAQIRKEYEAAKEVAENCYDVAKKRILEDKKEE